MRYSLSALLWDDHGDYENEVGFGESDSLEDGRRRADEYARIAGGPSRCCARVIDTTDQETDQGWAYATPNDYLITRRYKVRETLQHRGRDLFTTRFVAESDDFDESCRLADDQAAKELPANIRHREVQVCDMRVQKGNAAVYEASSVPEFWLVPAMFFIPNTVATTASEAREHVIGLLEDNDYAGVSYLTVGDEKDVTAEGGLPAWP